ncbi:GreA/GreB family elongation factor [Actinoallomurus sp. CA-150999]|uniref:GreA/GreB family elongation factor n=1 Tax=Actinoallomurus sp. CA-150999 TaxID=3239887 RepID=UPI003D93456C
METYRFLARDLEALKTRIARYEEQWREALSGIHDSTTQSSETWHDNPQFDEVQQRAKMLKTERDKLAAILHNSELVTPAAPNGRVDVGSVVQVRYAKTGREEQFVIGSYMVLDDDDDSRISYAAPLAKLLLGHRKGDAVAGKIGAKKIEMEVLGVGQLEESR